MFCFGFFLFTRFFSFNLFLLSIVKYTFLQSNCNCTGMYSILKIIHFSWKSSLKIIVWTALQHSSQKLIFNLQVTYFLKQMMISKKVLPYLGKTFPVICCTKARFTCDFFLQKCEYFLENYSILEHELSGYSSHESVLMKIENKPRSKHGGKQ